MGKEDLNELNDEQLEGIVGGNCSENTRICCAIMNNKPLFNSLSTEEQNAVQTFRSKTDVNAGWVVGNILKRTIGITRFGVHFSDDTYGLKDGERVDANTLANLVEKYKL